MQSTSGDSKDLFAKLVAYTSGVSKPKDGEEGSDFIKFVFRIVGGARDGQKQDAWCYLTTPGTVEKGRSWFRALGWNGKGDPAQTPVRMLTEMVSLKMVEKAFNGKTEYQVAWVNPIIEREGELSPQRTARIFGVAKPVPEGVDPDTGEEYGYEPAAANGGAA